MAHKPKLSTKTPDDTTTNALIEYEDDIVAAFNSRKRPNRHLAIVEIAATDLKIFEGGGRQATVQVRHLELVPSEDEAAVEKLFTVIHQARTGNTTRPKPTEPEDTDTPLEGLGADIDDSVDA